MRVHALPSAEPLLAMSYSRKKAEAVITGFEKSINDHLLKLLLVEDGQDRDHWTKELLEWFDEVAEIRLKPENRPGAAAFYSRILFDEPFGGTGVANVARRIRRLERHGYKLRDADPNDVLARLRRFHKQVSEAWHRGAGTEEMDDLLGALQSGIG